MTAVRLGRVAVALGLAVLLAAVGVTVGVAVAGNRVIDGVAVPRAHAVPLPADLGRTATGALPRLAAPPRPGPDTRVRITRLGVDADVVPVRTRGAVMQVPRDPRRVGWWRDGAVPGAARGSAVLVGHVNYDGTAGAFGMLPRLRPGDAVSLTGGPAFRVTAVRVYPKSAGLPPSIFARSGPPQLVMITCGGPFDPATGNYEDNIAVFARRVR